MIETNLVSVIIPTYNRADLLREAIESVLNQTYENFELLVLDNCSPDHTSDVVASFRDHRIKYLRHQCNIGSTGNYTYGLNLAKGKYVSFLPDDDRYIDKFLSNRMACFETNQEIAAVFSPFFYFDTDANKLTESSTPTLLHSNTILSGESLIRCEVGSALWHIGTTLYRTEVVRKYWEYASRGGKAGDTALNLRIAMNMSNKCMWIDSRDLIYRLHSQQDSIIGSYQMLLDHLMVFQSAKFDDAANKYSKYFNPNIVWASNVLGRMEWDRGNIRMSKRYFINELKADPTQLKTWVKLLLCIIYLIAGIKIKQT